MLGGNWPFIRGDWVLDSLLGLNWQNTARMTPTKNRGRVGIVAISAERDLVPFSHKHGVRLLDGTPRRGPRANFEVTSVCRTTQVGSGCSGGLDGRVQVRGCSLRQPAVAVLN